MSTRPLTVVTSKVVPLLADNIDTDQIIPARFLKVLDKDGLGRGLFADLRALPDGSPRADFPLAMARFDGAQILLAGDNFGCGSSREHAAWALAGRGIRVVISTSFADIFHANALKNGLVPVVVEPGVHATLAARAWKPEPLVATVDIEQQTLVWDGGSAGFPLDPFARSCLMHGVDELGYILRFTARIDAYEKNQEGEHR